MHYPGNLTKIQYPTPVFRNHTIGKALLLCMFFILSNDAFCQITNGNFNQPGVIVGASCNAGTGWTTAPGNLSCQYTNLLGPPTNFWIDLTPCWSSGNGTYIEQTVPTVIGNCYYLKFDLGAYCHWNMSDAGVYITINGQPLGPRIFNDSFDCSGYQMHWETRISPSFIATGTTTTIRFTGEGRCTKQSQTTGYNCTPIGSIASPGVMGIDNIELIAGSQPARASIDTAYTCGIGNGLPIKALGVSKAATIQWTVLTGSAVITGSGDSVNVTPNGFTQILMNVSDTGVCGAHNSDTITIFTVTANIDAGLPGNITGCDKAKDTLAATLTNTTAGINYDINWTPASYTVAYLWGNKLKPVVNLPATTLFTVTVSAAGCKWTDTVTVNVHTIKAKININDQEYMTGCNNSPDTLSATLTNTTPGVNYNINWTPAAYIVTYFSGDKLKPVVNPPVTTLFTVTVSAEDCKWTDTVTVNGHTLNAEANIDDRRICMQDTIVFNGSFFANANPALAVWYFGDGDSSTGLSAKHSYKIPASYNAFFVVTDNIPCTDTVFEEIKEITPQAPPYIANSPADTTVCSDVILQLPLGIAVGVNSYLWPDGSTNPRFYAADPGAYIVKLMNQCSVGYDTITIHHKDCSIWFPSAFTPNGDGKNDFARLNGKALADLTDFELTIYNRYGNQVFLTNNPYEGWDGQYNGKPQSANVYYYSIQYKLQNEAYFLKGDITLMR